MACPPEAKWCESSACETAEAVRARRTCAWPALSARLREVARARAVWSRRVALLNSWMGRLLRLEFHLRFDFRRPSPFNASGAVRVGSSCYLSERDTMCASCAAPLLPTLRELPHTVDSDAKFDPSLSRDAAAADREGRRSDGRGGRDIRRLLRWRELLRFQTAGRLVSTRGRCRPDSYAKDDRFNLRSRCHLQRHGSRRERGW